MSRFWKKNSESGSEPVTQAEAKLWLKLDSDLDEDDELVDELIVSARLYCEDYCNRAFRAKNITIRVNESDLDDDERFSLKFRANPTGMTITAYYEGSSSSVATTVWQVDEFSNMVELKYDQEWPDFDYLEVTYDVYDDVDDRVRKCIKNIVASTYNWREDGKDMPLTKVNNALEPLRQWEFK